MQALYAHEQEYWVRELAWDASVTWHDIEQGRTAGELPGLLVCDADGVNRGWAYFVRDGKTVHLGTLVADTIEATTALADAYLESAMQPPRPEYVSCFLPLRARGLEAVLVDRGFACEPYHYLTRSLTRGSGETGADAWREADLLPAARLLRESYGHQARHFAPHGTLEEWEHYLHSLVELPGCGVTEPTMTRVVRGHDRLDALVFCTRIAPSTLHLAQVAVHPSRQRHGLAHTLVDEACRAAASRGIELATLLVGDSNTVARRLYAKSGFLEQAQFLAAMRRVA